MNEVILYGIGVMLTCFGIATFFLSRIPYDIFSNEYDKKLDPLLPVLGTMFFGGLSVFFLFNSGHDAIKDYSFLDFILPFAFSGLIYFCYLLDMSVITNIVILICSLVMAFIQPNDFSLELGNLSIWQERIIIALIIFGITKGLALLNGLGGIASMQVMTVSVVLVVLAYFGAVPLLLAYIGIVYFGTMLAFIAFSWPNEKLVITNGGWNAIGFVLASLMLFASVERSEISMLIASSYLFLEVCFVVYNKIILNEKEEQPYMYTSYYKISKDGEYVNFVVYGVMKIFFIDAVLATFQIVAQERIALLIFSVAINLWLLQVLKGEAQPIGFFSVTRWGVKTLKNMFNENNEDTKKIEEKEEKVIEYKEEDLTKKETKTTTKPKRTSSKTTKDKTNKKTKDHKTQNKNLKTK